MSKETFKVSTHDDSYLAYIKAVCVALVLLILPAFPVLAVNLDSILESIDQPGQHMAYVLNTGDDALLVRVNLIRHAKTSIDIQTFIWANDDSGRFVINELWKAAMRGVDVRLLVDDMSVRKSADYVAYLASIHPNIAIKQYNPVSAKIHAGALSKISQYTVDFGQTNQRMHNKTVIVDQRFGITGGRNFADDYFDRGIKRSFKDRDLLIVGEVVGKMADSFEDYWQFERSIASEDMIDVARELAAGDAVIPEDARQYAIAETFVLLSQCADRPLCMENRIWRHGFEVFDVKFVADAPGKVDEPSGYAKTTQSLIGLMQNAKTSLVMQTPYLVVDSGGNKIFKEIRKKSPELEILVSTNSLGAADHFYAYAFSYKNKRKYVKSFKWKIFELKPTPADVQSMVPAVPDRIRTSDHYTCIHAKSFVFDDETVWLGSFNLDPRSASLNTEAGLVIKDDALAIHISRLIRQDTIPANSWTVGKRRKLPVFGFFNGVIESVFSRLPFLNVWPFSYATSFELRKDADVVPFDHPDFYKNYRSVGQFPGANLSEKALKTRLTKAFFGPIEPII